jgi:3-mercaptopyruvate sulfurtransferase SseA
VARTLLEHGWKDVRPLLGGFEAWQKAGLPLEPLRKTRSLSEVAEKLH